MKAISLLRQGTQNYLPTRDHLVDYSTRFCVQTWKAAQPAMPARGLLEHGVEREQGLIRIMVAAASAIETSVARSTSWQGRAESIGIRKR